MMMTRNKKSGFTLVELMVVAVIVAILAAVAIPLMSGNRTRAMATEAEAGLGTMRTSLRAMYAQTGAYNADLDGTAIAAGAAATAIPGISVGDLDGRYFDDAAYTISAVAADSYTLTAAGANSTAPGNADVSAVTITLSNLGAFTRAGL
jgi:prepilin-type N-terminal cleavage/methylation domain-containing protein